MFLIAWPQLWLCEAISRTTWTLWCNLLGIWSGKEATEPLNEWVKAGSCAEPLVFIHKLNLVILLFIAELVEASTDHGYNQCFCIADVVLQLNISHNRLQHVGVNNTNTMVLLSTLLFVKKWGWFHIPLLRFSALKHTAHYLKCKSWSY